MPPVRRLAPDRRREQLLDVALELAGDGEMSVRDVAARAGVSTGLLYYYFPTRQALLIAAVRRAADTMLAELAGTHNDDAPLSKLRSWLSLFLDHVQRHPTGWRALLVARSGELADIGAEIEQHALSMLLEVLDVSAPTGPLLVALTSWSALEREACLVWLTHGEVPRQVVEDLLLDSFLACLRAVAPHDEVTSSALERLTDR